MNSLLKRKFDFIRFFSYLWVCPIDDTLYHKIVKVAMEISNGSKLWQKYDKIYHL